MSRAGHAFDVCAFLANILVRGGAQSRGDHVTFRGAFEHAVAALMAVSANADAPAWPLALVSERAWCSFFCDIAWDATVILVDRPWITVLLATDSD